MNDFAYLVIVIAQKTILISRRNVEILLTRALDIK